MSRRGPAGRGVHAKIRINLKSAGLQHCRPADAFHYRTRRSEIHHERFGQIPVEDVENLTGHLAGHVAHDHRVDAHRIALAREGGMEVSGSVTARLRMKAQKEYFFITRIFWLNGIHPQKCTFRHCAGIPRTSFFQKKARLSLRLSTFTGRNAPTAKTNAALFQINAALV